MAAPCLLLHAGLERDPVVVDVAMQTVLALWDLCVASVWVASGGAGSHCCDFAGAARWDSKSCWAWLF
eukprot:3040840-Pyramimonas_sp.AAC.1